jgi:hypothetical protein
MSFAGIPDGEAHPYDDPSVADTITTRLVDARTLETVAGLDGCVVAVGRRVLSDDGRRMTIAQSGATPAGAPFANVSVYERA